MMTFRRLNLSLLLTVSLLGILVEGGTLDFCGFKYGAVHYGQVNMGMYTQIGSLLDLTIKLKIYSRGIDDIGVLI